MAESKKKTPQLSRKQALMISFAILFVVVGIVGFFFWQAKTPNHDVEKEAGQIDFEPRNDPVLMIPGPNATEEEKTRYEELVRSRMQGTDTLYVEKCQTHPIVAKMIDPTGLRIINEGEKDRTLIFSFGEYKIPANSTEYINIINDGGEGMHFYGCDISFTAGIIIAEDIEI